MTHRARCGITALAVLAAVLFAANIFFGAVHIGAAEVWRVLTGGVSEGPARFIIVESRLPQAVAAALGSASLAVAGLMLQTAFRNPLAGPSVLGITSGASLGVALVMLGAGGALGSVAGVSAVLAGALAGSFAVMALLLAMSALLRNELMLLIAGIMTGYLASSVITLLSYLSTSDNVYGYTVWGMGSFSGVGLAQLPLFSLLSLAGLLLAATLVKPLNVLQLGDNYARSVGVDIRRTRRRMLLSTGLLTAVVTAWCGPVAFIGLAVPHIARIMLRNPDHRVLMPATMLCGSAVGLLCNLMCTLPSSMLLPLNAVTPVIGVPVILYVILKGRKRR